MKFDIDPWNPEYGSSMMGEPDTSEAEVRLDVELPVDGWRAIAVSAPVRAEERVEIVFIDGVRRVEARTWISGETGSDAEPDPGVFASYGAGAARCGANAAEITEVEIGRCVASPSPALHDVQLSLGTFRALAAADGAIESLTYAVHQAMTKAEVRIAERSRRNGDELIVLDGPLRERSHVPDAVGLIKTHHVRYLDGVQGAIVAALAPCERTPVFLLQAAWSRYSWYLKLPSFDPGPWSGVVRCEASAELAPAVVSDLAQRVSGQLVRFASAAHKDARAPQNLYPIGGLERELRHRMGDAKLIYRALRVASRS